VIFVYVLYDFLSFTNIHLLIIILYIFLRKALGYMENENECLHYIGCRDPVLMKTIDVN